MTGRATQRKQNGAVSTARRRWVASCVGLLLQPVFFRHRSAFAQDPEAKFPTAQVEHRRQLLSGYRSAILRARQRWRLPIIDVEHHWGTGRGVPAFPVSDLLARMDENGVALTWLGVNESMGDAASLQECAKAPDRLVPTIMHGDGRRWHGRDSALFRELDKDVRSGDYFAMGEFEARHYVSNTNSRDVHTPVNSEGFETVFRASQETGLPFLLHHEAEDRLLPELEQMLARFPGAKVVWCHVGRNRDPDTWTRFPRAEGVREFIRKYPNLYFDVLQAGSQSLFPPNKIFGAVRESVLYAQSQSPVPGPAQLRPEWRQLFNDHADRFVLGSDINTGRWSNYSDVMGRLRNSILADLPLDKAESIAYKNAWFLMTGERWSE